jgi:hypothetical protein
VGQAGPPGPDPAAFAAAAEPLLPVMPFIAAAAHAPAVDPGLGGGGGEVMLEDVGLIVDGLVGNLQEGAIPVHLQRIIERFESIIQLDLTRRGSSSPWAWPPGGLRVLREAKGVYSWVHGAGAASTTTAAAAAAAGEETTGSGSGSSGRGSPVKQQLARSGQAGGGTDLHSLELVLLKPADVSRLMELPAEVGRGAFWGGGMLHLDVFAHDKSGIEGRGEGPWKQGLPHALWGHMGGTVMIGVGRHGTAVCDPAVVHPVTLFGGHLHEPFAP